VAIQAPGATGLERGGGFVYLYIYNKRPQPPATSQPQPAHAHVLPDRACSSLLAPRSRDAERWLAGTTETLSLRDSFAYDSERER